MSTTTNVMQWGELLFIPLDRPFPTSPWECLLSRFVLLFRRLNRLLYCVQR